MMNTCPLCKKDVPLDSKRICVASWGEFYCPKCFKKIVFGEADRPERWKNRKDENRE